MNYIKLPNLIPIFCIVFSINAQQVLTKKEAIAIALENNYGVQIANNNVEIAQNNASIYNSGYLPVISANAGANYNNSTIEFQRQGDEVQTFDGAVTNSYNASVDLNYTIFDGMGRKYNYEQLKENYSLSELEARATIENMYLQLFTIYFQIARLTENTKNLEEAFDISKQRLKRAEYQYEFGQTTKLEMLNAQVDINNDSINLINIKQQLANSKRDLSIILGTQTQKDYEVETEVDFLTLMSFDDLFEKAKSNNVEIIQNDQNLAINELNLRINRSNYLPTISLASSYGWNKSVNENPLPFQGEFNAATAFRAGLNLTWNIFDGGFTKTQVANAKIAIENQKIVKQQQLNILENQLRNIYESYQNALFVLEAQKQNVITNQNNFERTEERYKIGQVTSIEFRQAQINLFTAKVALFNAKFDAKLFELELLQLSGEILNIDF